MEYVSLDAKSWGMAKKGIMMTNIWAVAATHRPDIDKMNRTLGLLKLPKSRVVVVANGENPPTKTEISDATLLTYKDPVYNMPNWWNMGLEWISKRTKGKPYEVFVFGSDTMVSNAAVVKLAETLREYDLAATSPDRWNTLPEGHVHVETRLEPQPNMAVRMTGYAFVLKGELELRADPKFRSWYIDEI